MRSADPLPKEIKIPVPRAALIRFRSSYPDIPAYRNFSNSFFRVTVGDFRTKSEALRLLSKIKYEFPAAFLVHESIHYPAVNPVQ